MGKKTKRTGVNCHKVLAAGDKAIDASVKAFECGEYLLIHFQTVRKSRSATSAKLGELHAGAVVNVVEVHTGGPAGCVRARIANPSGWITFVDTRGVAQAELKDEGGRRDPEGTQVVTSEGDEADRLLAKSGSTSGDVPDISPQELADISRQLERAFAGPGLDRMDELCDKAELHGICKDLVSSVRRQAAHVSILQVLVEEGVACEAEAKVVADARRRAMRLGIHHTFTATAKQELLDFRRQRHPARERWPLFPGLQLLGHFCSKHEQFGAGAALVSNVKRTIQQVRELPGRLQPEIKCEDDLIALESACAQAKQLQVHDKLVLSARARVERCRSLEGQLRDESSGEGHHERDVLVRLVRELETQLAAAIETDDASIALHTACARAELLGVHTSLVHSVRRKIELHSRNIMGQLATQLMGTIDLAALEATYGRAVRLELSGHVVQRAKDTLEEVSNLKIKLQAKIEDARGVAILREACARAVQLGVHAHLVSDAMRTLAQLCADAEERLEAELEGVVNPATLKVACARAREFDVRFDLVSDAERILKEVSALKDKLRSNIKDASDVVVLQAACGRAEELGVHHQMVAGAKRALGEYFFALEEQLQTTCITSVSDAVAMRDAIDQASTLQVFPELVPGARSALLLRHFEVERQLEAEVTGVINVEALEEVCDHALCFGLCHDLVSEAKCILEEVSDLKNELCCRIKVESDVADLQASCARAEELGVHSQLVASARRILDAYFDDLEDSLQVTRIKSATHALDVLRAIEKASRLHVFGILVSTARSLLSQYWDLEKQLKLKVNNAGDAEVLETACRQAEQLQILDHLVVLARTEIDRFKNLASFLPRHHDTLQRLLSCFPDDVGKDVLKHILPDQCRIYSLEPRDYGERGGRKYYKPHGWLKFAVQVEDFHKDWCVAYHGTSIDKISPILAFGLLRPGDAAGSHGAVREAHGHAWSTTGRSIYLSPSIEYAAFPVYSQFAQVGHDHWAQLVLQCRVRPQSFQEKPGSLGNKYWPPDVLFDQHFEKQEGLEWLVDDPSAVVVSAFLVREFGPAANASLFGETATQVRSVGEGPEYEWSRLRQLEHCRLGFVVGSRQPSSRFGRAAAPPQRPAQQPQNNGPACVLQ